MKKQIEERTVQIARYIVENNVTVRNAARVFGLSKSTIHKDMTDRLPQLHPQLSQEIRKVLELNKSLRHIRGGMATRDKYKKAEASC